MAASLSLSLSLSSDPQPIHRLPFIVAPPNPRYPFLSFQKSYRFSCRSSPDSSPSSTTIESTSASTIYSSLEDSFKTGRFLSNDDLKKLKVLQDFRYYQELESGSMWVRVMRPEEIDITVKLLAESFAESMVLPVAYASVLRFLVKQYLIERRDVLPHAVTLIGFYRGKESEDEEELAGTVEVCFDKMGANASSPTPAPPKNSPYICNMTVKKSLRRRGIGWNLLKASEELISQMFCDREVYLHCRMIDSAPFIMYTKAGYSIAKTDSMLILLMLQRRKYLMYKKLPDVNNPLASDVEVSSHLNVWKA